MTGASALQRLAEMAGILPGYHDIHGQWHETSDDTRRALLGCMGIACNHEQQVQAALSALQQREWGRWLAPVHVVAQGQASQLTLRVPQRLRGARFHWQLNFESGTGREGEFVPDSLPVLGASTLGQESFSAVAVTLPKLDECGYHRLRLSCAEQHAQMTLIVHPPSCYTPAALADGQRVWGLAVQLYGVRSARNWGVGDFTDLRHLVEWAAASGAGLVGVNPLHALFPHNPRHCSPYSPSSRCFLNAAYIDVEAVPEFAECKPARELVADPEFQAQLRALRAAALVDYAEVAQVKRRALDLLFRHFREQHLARSTPRAKAFRKFVDEGGERLAGFALYQALQAHLFNEDRGVWGWPVWPKAYQDPHSPQVSAFAAAHGDQIEYFQYLEWLAREQLEAVGRRSWELGLGVGLYQDLAVGVDGASAETWRRPELFALAAHIGSPPDDFNLFGQDWGLPPWLPQALRDAAYEPFIATLRANMRHAGALRLDHVMALMRLYWVAPGVSAAQGAYVAYPLRDLFGVLALESQRSRCLVIGEDLGTVPEEVRACMLEFGVLSYRLFYFERDASGAFAAPDAYPKNALVAASTHDLPTLAGYWRGLDLDLRRQLKLFTSEQERETQIVARSQDRARLLMALEHEDLLPEGVSVHPVTVPDMSPALIQSIHRYLARSPAKLSLVQAEDMLGEQEQANLPGTTDGHPNWQRKLSLNLEEWAQDARIAALAQAMVTERGSAVREPEALPFPLRAVNAPRATYRVQMRREFNFAALRDCVRYLAELGISHVYCSPYFKARPGSSHGYDLIDHNQLNPEVGSEADFEALCAALAEHSMGQLLDVVPNHMGIMGAENAWWLDVLENGQASAFASYFDIEWYPNKPELHGKVLVPVLGDHYGSVLERGELKLGFAADTGDFSLWYYEHRFPIDPREYPRLLQLRVAELGARMGEAHPDFLAYQSLATAFQHLPARAQTDAEHVAERRRDQAVHKARLAELHRTSPDIQQFIQENVTLVNGRVGDPASFDLLHELILAQAFRLAFWRVAADEINYRRFFDINDLAALRMESSQVFAAAHGMIARMLQRNQLQGLRIDHADGLFDPTAYFQHLQQLHREAHPTAREALYVLVEKILAPHERLREEWAIAGTTGYEFLNQLNGLFVDPDAAESLPRLYRSFTRDRRSFEDILDDAKRIIMKGSLASELNMLATRLARIAEMDRYTRDYTLNRLRTALADIVACFPIYRTYICQSGVSEDDRRHVEWACSMAKKRASIADTTVYDFVRDVLLGTAAEGKNEAYRHEILDFVMRFQQFTSPVMAKGMEDTAFYRYHPLASLNEVGGEPRRFGVSVNAFHHMNQERARRNPHSMLATATHDTKRSEDARARLNVLSEMPARWHKQVNAWHRLNRARLGYVDGVTVPTVKDEYLLYQSLVGIWPDTPVDEAANRQLIERVSAYMIKAVREAKEYSSWVNPNQQYEGQLGRFVEAILAMESGGRFRQELEAFATELAHFGRINSLAQTLLKLTVPGVPDLYQGTELWDFSLVDPDNRRPVDYGLRRELLGQLQAREAAQGAARLSASLLETASDGAVKLYVVWKTLQLRRRYPALFEDGDYVPLPVEGSRAAHVVAFARRVGHGPALLVVVPRLVYGLLGGDRRWPCGTPTWDDTHVPLVEGAASWRNIFTGEVASSNRGSVSLRDWLGSFPVGLWATEPE